MPKYYKKDDYGYKCLLLVKPGVTGEATLKYKGEDTILALSENPERTYEEEVFPEKVKMNINYIRKITLLNDFNIIIKTVYYVFLVRSDKSSISINSEVKVSINE
jgi:lipopolysaccharide/colanic/teichoic acid biosynthesis glycosyltransferase